MTLDFFIRNQWIIWVLILWMIPWKGVALWKSARNGHKAWFVALLLINTLAILDVVYIVFFSGENKIEKQELVAGNNNTKRLIV